jgi:hypothetical protein
MNCKFLPYASARLFFYFLLPMLYSPRRICHSVFALIWTHTLQEMVPGNMLGRVYSIDAVGSFVLLPIGFALADWGTDLLGAPRVFLIGGIGIIVLVLLGLSHPAIRSLD